MSRGTSSARLNVYLEEYLVPSTIDMTYEPNSFSEMHERHEPTRSPRMSRSSGNSKSAISTRRQVKSQHEGVKGEYGIKNPWEAAHWGTVSYLTLPADDSYQSVEVPEEKKLNLLRSTSIAGNDITSSVLYASGLVLQAAGRMAPLCITLVALTLYLFRSIYSEVGSALPMNGGTYNALLNTANKFMASIAACLSLLSYTATAVVSAESASEYLQVLYPDITTTYITIGILFVFAILTYIGITDSANVAAVIFIGHISTISAVLMYAVLYTAKDHFALMGENFSGTGPAASPTGSIASDVFFGFGTALLGVSGFESSSNYIEEQQEGVFPKTLRNMWAIVAFFNPAMCVFIMGVVPLPLIVFDDNYANAVLANIADITCGTVLRAIVVADAFVVLSGAVLTAYVGIVGLMRRLALDRCLPHFLLQTNSWRGTNHYIILVFFILTASLRLLVSDMVTLGGVYGIAFLSVMSMFTVANILLKYKRNKLPRTPITSYWHALFALTLVVTGFFASVLNSLVTLQFFLLYTVMAMVVILGMYFRVQLMRFFAQVAAGYPSIVIWLTRTIYEVRSVPIVFFSKTPSLSVLNKAVLYILDNEDTNCVRVVHCFKNREEDAATLREFEESWAVLDKLYPKLTVELYLVEGEFGPEMVHRLSAELNVPKNFMFMTCPGNKGYHIGRFGGIRIILR